MSKKHRGDTLFTGIYVAILLIFIVILAIFSPISEAAKRPDNALCYAQAAYYEARGQGTTAMRLVQEVTYNRVLDNRWAQSACGVVWQHRQYSWTDSTHNALPEPQAKADREALQEALKLARSLRAGKWKPDSTANHFLSPDGLTGAFPRWAQCNAELQAANKCVTHVGTTQQLVRAPDYTYEGLWFYTI